MITILNNNDNNNSSQQRKHDMNNAINTIIDKIMNKEAMITFLGFFLVFLGIFFSSTLLILLLPSLLILIGVLKLYEWNEKQ